MGLDFSKPLLLYSMPRSRSTAILESCKKQNKIFEPFNPLTLFGVDYNHILDKNLRNIQYLEAHKKFRNLSTWYESNVRPEQWSKLFESLSGSNTVSKIISNSLYQWMSARMWFKKVEVNGTHNIFVIWRDIKDIILSIILADKYGYFKNVEVDPYPFTVKEESIYAYRQQVEYYVQFMPSSGYIITFEDLPQEYFNKSTIVISDQESNKKLEYIENLDFVLEQVDCIDRIYKPLIEEKLGKLVKL